MKYEVLQVWEEEREIGEEFPANGGALTPAQAVRTWSQVIESAPVAAALLSPGGTIYLANESCWTDVLGVIDVNDRLARDQDYCARLAEGSGVTAKWEVIWQSLAQYRMAELPVDEAHSRWRIRFQMVPLPGAEAVLAWHWDSSGCPCDALLDGLRDVVFRLDGAGRILSISRSVETVLGYRPDQLKGTPITGLITHEHIGRVADRLRAYARNEAEPGCFEFEAIHQNGERRWLESNSEAVRHGGGPLEIHGVVRDITGRKRIEEELRRAQAAKSMGLLAAGAAHDINNVITVINGYCERLRDRFPDLSPEREDIDAVLAAAGNATAIARQFIALSRGRKTAAQPCDLNKVIEHSATALGEAGRGVRIEYRLDPKTGEVAMDQTQLQQVLLNLVLNARDAMEGKGFVAIVTRKVADEGMVLLSVRDSGPGVPAGMVDKIFEPFFSTKGASKGNGLGLFTVRELVRQAGGMVNVCTPAEGGTEFQVLLPAAEATPKPAPKAQPGRCCETILVVEDERALRELVKDRLEAAGYRVFAVADGEAALNAESACSGPIDLLVSDVRLPGMSGLELAARMRARRPGLFVLYVSGNPDDDELAARAWQYGEDFIGKPFRPQQLAAAVGRLMGEAANDPARILIADDHRDVLDTLSEILESCGHSVRRAVDGREVEQLLAAEPFDLLITDLAMPEKDGLEVIRALRGKRNGMQLIAMSGLMNGVLLESALRLGADAVVDKPLSRDTLLTAVRRVLRRQRAARPVAV